MLLCMLEVPICNFYLARDREIKISIFFATFLCENEALGLEQAAVVTMATRVLRPLKRAFYASP